MSTARVVRRYHLVQRCLREDMRRCCRNEKLVDASAKYVFFWGGKTSILKSLTFDREI